MAALNEPTNYTADEIREIFLRQVWGMIDYWENHPLVESFHERMVGLAFSIFTILDGETAGMPGFIVSPNPHPSDRQYHIDRSEKWFPPDLDIAGSLHDTFLSMRPPMKPLSEMSNDEKNQLQKFVPDTDLSFLPEGGAGIDRRVARRDDLLPTDATPFGDMAALFGAATTVMLALQREAEYAPAVLIRQKIYANFSGKGVEFCEKVMGIILQYYAGHTDRTVWDATNAAYRKLLASGFDGLDRHRLRQAVNETTSDPDTADAAEKRLIDTYYSHLKNY